MHLIDPATRASSRPPRLRQSLIWLLCLLIACGSASAWAVPALLLAKQAKPAASASVETDPAADGEARDRIAARLREVDGLQAVIPSVSNGAATLDGLVRSEQMRKAAATIAAGTPGITKVDNRIEVHTPVSTRLRAAWDLILAKMIRLLAALPLLVVAIVIVLLASWIGGFLSRRLHWLRIKSRNPYMDGLLRRVVQTIALLIGVLIALDLLGATSLVGAVLGSAGVIGLVVGFAFRDIAENYVSGVLLSLRRPFAPGDHVMIDNREGKVVALSSRNTVLMTMDGNELRIPNAMVFKSIVLNYSQNPQRRFEFTITIDAAESIGRSQDLALLQIAKVPGVLEEPAPSSVVQDFAPTGIVLRFFGWVDQRETDLGKSRGEAIRLVKAAFADAGIAAPQTTYNIVSTRKSVDADEPRKHRESTRVSNADTSVNRDIDTQLAAAQRAGVDEDLLEAGGPKP
ncbi:small-conductance mechanosensitive channel [Luteimonas cucumeris]|uniref:Small-conductance mechanosensitive channel n=1 Tax=Luteimonas cucumeris TaxID=985012 RepID=A0A562LA73_9GAMM|nr:mechanosensitive ion channel domain-containing protein [Luteimonas cucumeris]TWI04521.1 small-conductance mechanosensitive channel [Luteimonas cucumeris]